MAPFGHLGPLRHAISDSPKGAIGGSKEGIGDLRKALGVAGRGPRRPRGPTSTRERHLPRPFIVGSAVSAQNHRCFSLPFCRFATERTFNSRFARLSVF